LLFPSEFCDDGQEIRFHCIPVDRLALAVAQPLSAPVDKMAWAGESQHPLGLQAAVVADTPWETEPIEIGFAGRIMGL
jgi:hypothetical protein